MVKKILVTLDNSPSTDTAIRHSIEIGKFHNAEVTGITFVHVKKLENVGPVPIGAGYSAKNLREFRLTETNTYVDEVINKFESALSGSGLNYRIEREKGDPFRFMISFAKYQDLLITGLRSIFDYGVVREPKNLLRRLASAGIGPIFAVGAEFNPIRRVLVAYDGSMNLSGPLNKFIQLKIWPDVFIRIVHFDREDEKSKKFLLDMAEDCIVNGFKTEVESIEGPAKTQLLKHASEWKADLIVMGNSSRSLLARRVFGDLTMHAIEHSEKPLFLGLGKGSGNCQHPRNCRE